MIFYRHYPGEKLGAKPVGASLSLNHSMCLKFSLENTLFQPTTHTVKPRLKLQSNDSSQKNIITFELGLLRWLGSNQLTRTIGPATPLAHGEVS